MATAQQLEENRQAYAVAKAQAAESDGMVCGTLDPDGRPRYYVVPRETDDVDLAKRAFALRNGRDMSPGEELLVEMAKERMGGTLARRP